MLHLSICSSVTTSSQDDPWKTQPEGAAAFDKLDKVSELRALARRWPAWLGFNNTVQFLEYH